MKVSRKIQLSLFFLLVASCGSSSVSDNSNPDSTTTSSSIALPDCSASALDAAAGESTYVLGCVGEWAAIQLKSSECGEHCYGYVYQWVNSNWKLLGMCSQYSLIMTEDNSCEAMSGFPKDQNFTGQPLTVFPPSDVACQIWESHRFEENLAITGCKSDSEN